MVVSLSRSRLKISSRETGSTVPSGPASACSFPTIRLHLVLTHHGIPPAFHDGVYLYRPATTIGSVPRLSDHLTLLRTDSVHCLLHTNSGCRKERRIFISLWGPAKAAPVCNYLEVYWPCAGGLSAVNAIGTQLRDPINSGLARWRMEV